nr:PCI domain-containing protein [Candidatus Sigynarchaeota archaeon]
MSEKTERGKYKYTSSYKRFQTSLACVFTSIFPYIFIEILWNALGYYLSVDILIIMAQVVHVPMVVMICIFIVLAVRNYKIFKKKVGDGTIHDELYMPASVPGVISSILPVLQGMNQANMKELTPEEKKIKGLIQMYPKITLANLASKASIPESNIEDILLHLISNDVIKGHIDPGTGEFISGMIDTTRVKPVDDAIFDCPHCGAVMDSAPVRGTSVWCRSCGNLIVVK